MSAAILAFPYTRKAVRLRNIGMDAAGLLSLLLLEREGQSLPANVTRFDGLDDEMPTAVRSVERLLLMLTFSALPAKKREDIKRLARGMAYGEDADTSSVQLYSLLKLLSP